MNTELRSEVEGLLTQLGSLLQAGASSEQLEVAFARLYFWASDDARRLALIEPFWPASKAYAPWRELARLALNAERGATAGSKVKERLRGAPQWTQLLVGTEAADLLWEAGDADTAWRLVEECHLLDTLDTLRVPLQAREEDLLLLAAACGTLLRLAGVKGRLGDVMRVSTAAAHFWAAEHELMLTLGLATAEVNLNRGDYRATLSWLERWQGRLPETEQLRAQTAKLQALVGLGLGSSERSQFALRQLIEVEARGGDVSGRSREHLLERVRQLVALSPELQDVLEAAPESALAVATGSSEFRKLFARESALKRDPRPEQRRSGLLGLLERVESTLDDAQPQSPSDLVRLQLLWCRLVVECDQSHAFPVCETILTSAIERCRQLGTRPLELLALDQRGLLRVRLEPPDERGAIEDSMEAAALGLSLVSLNSDRENASGGRRALLENLLPTLDRVIEVQAVLAASVLPQLAEHPDAFSDALWAAETAAGRWQRLGRSLQGYAEQAQKLALADARRARAHDDMLVEPLGCIDPHAPPWLDSLRAGLAETHGVLQYFLVGGYLLVFASGRRFFDWYLKPMEETESAEREVMALVSKLRDWTQGADPSSRDALQRLQELLLPAELRATLERAGLAHLFIVPHGALYQVPFGRLAFRESRLALHFSLSLHPTAELALESARAQARPPRRPTLAHVIGPEQDSPVAVACSGPEALALRRNLSRAWPRIRVETIEGFRSTSSELAAGLGAFDLLHFTCHGLEGGAFGQVASIQIAATDRGRLPASAVSKLDLRRVVLVVLQSCWTGWMDHRRANPVQGMPQAFCDAGVQAVIAPLTQVPMALSPIFTRVLYAALRFLPAEVALQRALTVVRRYGAVLVRGDAEAEAAFRHCGCDLDRLEYRYTGIIGLRLGNRFSRWLAELSFWWLERSLRLGLEQSR